jgi:uncharacterized protein YbjT (DUF2867 family)
MWIVVAWNSAHSGTMKQEILVVGITGMMGGKIANAILDRGEHEVRAMVRNLEQKRGELKAFTDRGVKLVEGDVMQPAGLDAAVDGVSAVVSAVNNMTELIVDGQTNLLRAAERQGVKRFLPSDFSVDYRKVAMGDNYNLDMRKKFLPVVQDSKVAHTSVINGAFYEVVAAPFLGFVDMEKKQVTIWGDGEQKMEFTGTDDVAKYVAATVLDPRTENRALSVAGEVLSSNEVAAMFGFEKQQAGSVPDLKARIVAKQVGAMNPWAYLGDQYLWAMVSGAGQADTIDNAMYPEITPVRLKAFFGMA